MRGSEQVFVFNLDARLYALYLAAVKRVVRVVDITPLPKAPDIIRGIINMGGEIVPVFDIRKRFGLPSRETRLSDQMVIAQTSTRTVALIVDETQGPIGGRGMVAAERFAEGSEYVAGVMKLENGMVLIHDLDTFLSNSEQQALDIALKEKDDAEGK